MNKIRIATRKSPLAMWQAEHVRDALIHHHPGLQVELIGMETQGDRILDSPLAKIGGKGLFIKELEQKLLDNSADIAVHSMKDVPVDLPNSLILDVILQREDPRDAFVSNEFDSFQSLPDGAVVGTSSLRRQCQIMALRPDLRILDLRGNVGTRLRKLDEGEYQAIVLAAAGLKRLEQADRIRDAIDDSVLLPAIGQGAVGIECRENDPSVQELIAPLNDRDTAIRVTAERGVNKCLFGGCQVPIAGFALLNNGQVNLRALVGRVDGSEMIRGSISGPPEQAEELGIQLGENLLAQGADVILKELMDA